MNAKAISKPLSNPLRIGILGATGAVGEQMLKVLDERQLPIAELRLFGSARSAGKTLRFQNQDIVIQEASLEAFKGLDVMLGAAANDVAKAYLPDAARAGVLVIDNSSAFRLDPNVPLVIPEINPEDAQAAVGKSNYIANPNCATIIGLVAIAPLHRYARVRRLIASTYQAVSGAGVAGIRELEEQVAHPHDAPNPQVFAHPIAYNLIPQIGSFNDEGYSTEEMKMQNEGRKILHEPDLRVACTCVRVPIIRSHSEALTVEFERPITPEKARELLANAPGVRLMDEPNNGIYPMPLHASDQDMVDVGRIRRDLSAFDDKADRTLTLFCAADQIRKGAATNAIQILESVWSLL